MTNESPGARRPPRIRGGADDEPTVFVIDDDLSVREAIAGLAASAGLRTETFPTAQAFLAASRPEVPGCLVLDVRLPGTSGLDLQKELAAAGTSIPIVFISDHGDVPTSVRAMKAGAVEFLTKPFRTDELLGAVQEAIARDRVARRDRGEAEELRRRYDRLTRRERQVLALVVAGRLNKQIAAELGTREVTVKVHRAHVMQKMHAGSLADLVRMTERLSLPGDRRTYTKG